MNKELREEVAQTLIVSEYQNLDPPAIADAILAIPAIAEALAMQRVYISKEYTGPSILTPEGDW